MVRVLLNTEVGSYMDSTPQFTDGKNVAPPKPGERRWVQCSKYRTLAVWGADGKWRTYFNGIELTDVIRVFDE